MRKIIAAIAIVLTLAALARAEKLDMRDLDGEELHFLVTWTGIPAAEASLETEVLSSDRVRFTARAKSLSAVGLIYPMNTKIESVVSLPLLHALEYSKSGREGWGTVNDRKVVFYPDTSESCYFRDGKLRKKMTCSPDVQDPLSCFYVFRQAELSETEPYRFKVNDGTKIVDSDVTIVGREELTTKAGTFRTLKIRVNMENVGGVFAKSPGSPLLMWLTDDKFRRPVKMYSKVKVGDFTATLEHIGPPEITLPVPSTLPLDMQ